MEPPKVFASYSHDSDEHKKWVRKFCTKLRENEVDVTLDQWDLGPGDDRIVFMEKGVRDSDRVLAICTDAYVRKANARERGAGFEGYIITAELVEDLGTDKFIPIIRQSTGKEKTPTFLKPKVYLDFTNDTQFDVSFDQLLREIHGAPLHPKPPLGENPFSKLPPEVEISSHSLLEIFEIVESASDAYKTAEALIVEGNKPGWLQFVKKINQNISKSLQKWKLELVQLSPKSKEQLFKVIDQTVDIVSPLICVSLAGVESKEKEFNSQKSVLHDLFTITEWKDSSYTVWIDMPNPLRYVYHSLHGGLALKTDQLTLALNIAKEEVRITYPESKGKVWKMGELTGGIRFSSKMGPKDHWELLADAYKRWEWLSNIFANDLEYRSLLVAYYMALNIYELATVIDSGDQEDFNNYRLKVPLDFLSEEYETKERATDILLRNSGVPELWECLNVTEDQMKNFWEPWIDRCKQRFWNDYRGRYYKNDGIHHDHENFFDNL